MARPAALTALPDGEDRAALETLYWATQGPNWLESRNWLTEAPLGEWYGVSTNETGRVGSLGLSDKDLTGPIPPEVGNLAALEVLDLNGNNLTGPIPREISNLTALQKLRLAGNQLTGPIPPEIGNLAALKRLYLDGNRLVGRIPAELGNLAALEVLDLNGNELLFGWFAHQVVLSPRARLPGLRVEYLAELKDAYLAEWKEAHPAEWKMWKDEPEFLELIGIYPAGLEKLLAALTDAHSDAHLADLQELHEDYHTVERDYDAEDHADDLAKEMDRFWQTLTDEDQ